MADGTDRIRLVVLLCGKSEREVLLVRPSGSGHRISKFFIVSMCNKSRLVALPDMNLEGTRFLYIDAFCFWI